jgi:enoyl-CoA hydratase
VRAARSSCAPSSPHCNLGLLLNTTRSFATSPPSSPTPSPPLVLFNTAPANKRVGVLTLNAPSRLNALTVEMASELHTVLTTRVDYSEVGALVVTGAGRAFSAGGDFTFLRQRSEDSGPRNAALMRRFYDLFLSVRRDVPVPLIAAINGPAVGAGLCFALGMDLRVAAKSAKLGTTFVGIGLHPGLGCTHFLPRLVGPQVAARMLLTGELISGEQAAREGLVLEAVDDERDVLPRAVELGARIAAQAPVAVRGAVRSLRMGLDEGLDRALWREADAQSYSYSGPDLREGVEAVMAKRSPVWTQWETYGWGLGEGGRKASS